ncbi:MAG: penicillin-binding protein [Polyangiaceae bacterium]|nr:penicillin-binding protein [Polyangiaceae bacterium]
MTSWTRWIGIGTAVGIISALVPVVRGDIGFEGALRKLSPRSAEAPKGPDLTGLDLLRLDMRPRRVVAPLSDGRHAELTLDPVVQRAAVTELKKYRVPEGAVVMQDVRTGEILAYASYVNEGDKFDVNVRAEPPAASIFKVITGAALVEKSGLSAKTEQCYHGGRSAISADELKEDPARDKWCATLAMAMGRSLNVVFGRLAQKHLTPEDVTAMGGAFGFGAPVPFVVPNEPSAIDIPGDPLEFARASAGFWHTGMSPLAGVVIAQTVANGGVALEPRIIKSIHRGQETLWQETREPVVLRRAVKPETAKEVTDMMLQTTANGSAYKSFHDGRGRAFLPGIAVAGKTGTLTRHKQNRHYTWFVGFAPADKPEVAISALVVNTPTWRIKGPELARNVLRAHFAKKGQKGVTPP